MHVTTAGETAYDRVPYTASSFPEAHPWRMRSVAALYGLNSPPVERARVLELGCAVGGNLLPMAYRLPGAWFVGVDLSARQIEAARSAAAQLDLTNVDFRQMNIADIGPDFGTFDYIIAHGVYSWVPADVRNAIMRVCRQNLSPDGVAYISYNVYPGWHLQRWVREMMIYAARTPDGHLDVAAAREFVKLASQSPVMNRNATGWLSQEVQNLQRKPDAYVIHEYLEEVNEPVYFHQFVAHAAAHGLRYIADARFNATILDESWDAGRQAMARSAGDAVRLEQLSDFLRNRVFRRSLLCHETAHPDRAAAAGRIKDMWIVSGLRRDAAAVGLPPDVHRFVTPRGGYVHTNHPALKACIPLLQERCPQPTKFDDLVDRAASAMPQVDRGTLAAELAAQMYNYWKLELIEIQAAPIVFPASVGDRPRASPVARLQALSYNQVTNLRHEMVRMDDACRRLLPLIDGTRTREQLARKAIEDKLLPAAANMPLDAALKAATDSITGLLNMLARNALLVE